MWSHAVKVKETVKKAETEKSSSKLREWSDFKISFLINIKIEKC